MDSRSQESLQLDAGVRSRGSMGQVHMPERLAKLEARLLGNGNASLRLAELSNDQNQENLLPGVPRNVISSEFGAQVPMSHVTSMPVKLPDLPPTNDSDSDDDLHEFSIVRPSKKRKAVRSLATSRGKDAIVYLDEPDNDLRESPTSDRNSGPGPAPERKHPARGVNVRHSGCQVEDASLREMVQQQKNRAEELEAKLVESRQSCEQLQRDCSQRQEEVGRLKDQVASLQQEIADQNKRRIQKEQRLLHALSESLVTSAKSERELTQLRLQQEGARLGRVGVMRAGTVISEVWEDGQALKDIHARLASILEQRDEVEKRRKALRKQQQQTGSSAAGSPGSAVVHRQQQEGEEGEEDANAAALVQLEEEVFRSRLQALKREEESVLKERERVEVEKATHMREVKRQRDEEGSRFNKFAILNRRYALLNLLGKGGFSEVFKAFDLSECRFVACKLHQLNPSWREDKKHSFVRHALREYNIHKALRHPHIVSLLDIFEIDANTFATVLEYCPGLDLDAVLKATPTLPEREARSIISQVFSGLAYLNRPEHRVIHYDLKPGNILLDCAGQVKISDFGLSKVVEEEAGSGGMELTSQGAGTYWYLPPECFDIKKTPLISSKVDVWSAGVLLFQMLFGRRPFGHNLSQESILREETIIRATAVDFPSKPAVSGEAKEFIQRCLTYDQKDRPDVVTAARDPYVSAFGRKKTAQQQGS